MGRSPAARGVRLTAPRLIQAGLAKPPTSAAMQRGGSADTAEGGVYEDEVYEEEEPEWRFHPESLQARATATRKRFFHVWELRICVP